MTSLGLDAEGEVLAVFDDVTTSAMLLEWSSVLARVTRRDLAVLYVESAVAMRAAALPITQVLSHAGATWARFEPGELERSYRIQAERLRVRAEQVARRHAVRCSLRTARGAPAQAALTGASGATLVVLGGARPLPARRGRAAPLVLLLFDAAAPAAWLHGLAQELAVGLGGTFSERRVLAADLPAALALVQADLVVLPRHLASADALAASRQPLLLVGSANAGD